MEKEINRNDLRDKILEHLLLNKKDTDNKITVMSVVNHFKLEGYTQSQVLAQLMMLKTDKEIELNKTSTNLFLDRIVVISERDKKDYGTFIKFGTSVLIGLTSAFLLGKIIKPDFINLSIGDPTHPEIVDSLVTKKMNETIWKYKKEISSDSVSMSQKDVNLLDLKLINVNARINLVEENFKNINNLLESSPEKFVQIASIKKDIDGLDKQLKYIDESLKKDISNMYSLILALFALLTGLFAANFWPKSKD